MDKNLNGKRIESCCDCLKWNECWPRVLSPKYDIHSSCPLPNWQEPEKPAPGAVVVVTVSPEEWEAKAARIRELVAENEKLRAELSKAEPEREWPEVEVAHLIDWDGENGDGPEIDCGWMIKGKTNFTRAQAEAAKRAYDYVVKKSNDDSDTTWAISQMIARRILEGK